MQNQIFKLKWKGRRRGSRRKGEEGSGLREFTPDANTQQKQQQWPAAPNEGDRRTLDDESATLRSPALFATPTPEDQFARSGGQGPKGDKGDAGAPGVCSAECLSSVGPIGPPGPSGPKGVQGDPGIPGIGRQGLPGTFDGLTEDDLTRIAAWPGVKGEKGECLENSNSNRLDIDNNNLENGLPAYDSRLHRHSAGAKGEKGDRGAKGEQGVPGMPAPRVEQQPQAAQQFGGGAAVFQTSVELFAAAHHSPVGSLAFSISSQQLFIRVNNGWRLIQLDKFYPGIEQRPSARTQEDQVLPPSSAAQLEYEQSLLISGTRRPLEIQTLSPPPVAPVDVNGHHQAHHHAHHYKYETDFKPTEGRHHQPAEAESTGNVRHRDRVLHLIALNEPMSGDFHGVRGADLECYRQARQAGFSTTFRAFISSRVQDVNKIVHFDDRRNTPIVNLRGERLFDSWNALFDGTAHSHVPLYSFNRRNIYEDTRWSDRLLWHGSNSNGLRALGAFCDDGWRSAHPEHYAMASVLHSAHSLTNSALSVRCNRRLAVLCVENMSKFNVDRRIGKRISSSP